MGWILKKRRDATRVIHDILRLASDGLPKTRIINQANLNFRIARSYLEFLVDKGYLSKRTSSENGIDFYEITDSGKDLLHNLQRVEADLEGLFLRGIGRGKQ